MHIEAEVSFFIHKKIKGEHFPLDAYEKASSPQQQDFKDSVVDFLIQMHGLKGLTAYEYVCKIWTKEPERFRINPTQHIVGLNT